MGLQEASNSYMISSKKSVMWEEEDLSQLSLKTFKEDLRQVHLKEDLCSFKIVVFGF
jgi:hypothetical protein